MSKLKQLSRLIGLAFFLVIYCSCTTVITNLAEGEVDKTKDNEKPVFISNVNWKAIDLPIHGESLVLSDDNIFVIGIEEVRGTEEIVSLNQKMEVQKLPPIKVISEYTTKDGGLTREVSKLEKKDKESRNYKAYLCPPENAAFLSKNLYVFSICEHTTQLWKVTFDEKSTLLNLINFTYYDIDSGDKSVFGPYGLSTKNSKALFPSSIKKGPALLTEDKRTGNLKVAWQGVAEDGGVVAVDFIGRNGWMLLGGGKFLQSFDGGETWQYFSNTRLKAEDIVVDLKFRNEQEGYIIGLNGLILSTINGGKTWEFQNSGINTTLYEIAINENTVAVSGLDGSLLINRKGNGKWDKIEAKPDGNISDLLFYNDKLHVLIEGKLYISNGYR